MVTKAMTLTLSSSLFIIKVFLRSILRRSSRRDDGLEGDKGTSVGADGHSGTHKVKMRIEGVFVLLLCSEAEETGLTSSKLSNTMASCSSPARTGGESWCLLGTSLTTALSVVGVVLGSVEEITERATALRAEAIRSS